MRSTPGQRCARQSGFSLLELLVAFAIMAISLGMLYRVAGGAVRNVSDVAYHQQATMLAESLLARHGSLLAGGWNEDGESAGYKWNVRSQPYRGGENTPQAVPLHEILLSISWQGGSRPGRLDVVTLLPERRPPPGGAVP